MKRFSQQIARYHCLGAMMLGNWKTVFGSELTLRPFKPPTLPHPRTLESSIPCTLNGRQDAEKLGCRETANSP
jgi:hypothetical protein